MLVILKENVDNLGKIGDIVTVKDGYARNYLLPQQLVLVADQNNLKNVNHYKKILEKKRIAQIATAEALVAKLKDFSCTIKRKSGEQDKLFGSVTTADVADALVKGGYKVDKKQVHLSEPIKTLGVHMVDIKLSPEVTGQVKVWVVKENG
jgi:large subunit ribosomal protein L9